MSAEGRFLQLAIPPGRNKLNNKDLEQMTKPELVDRFKGVRARYGTYAVSGNRLTRRELADLDPNLDATESVQEYRIEGDVLILTETAASKGKVETRFRRVKQ